MKKAFYLVLCALISCSILTSCIELTPPHNNESETVGQTSIPETNPPEALPPETAAPDTEPQILRPADFDFDKSFQADTFKSKDNTSFPYRLYLPEGYSENEDYPLLVYLHTNTLQGDDNERPLHEAEMLFKSPSSPAYGSIVLIPQCPEEKRWEDKILASLTELIDFINTTYSTDPNRQYYVGSSMGADALWQMMERYPERISAVVSSADQKIYLLKYPDGTLAPVGLFPQMAEIPICLAYDKSDTRRGEVYCTAIRDELVEYGAENILLKGVDRENGTKHLEFVSEDDISVLQWLFRQERATGEPAPETKAPKVEVEYAYFSSAGEFEFGEFTASNGITLPYRYYIPLDYDESKEYPLLLFLHTNGQQGTCNVRHLHQVDPYFANANSPAYESIVIVPQCPPDYWWGGETIDAAAELMGFINSQYSTDLSRQYVAGISMGGGGTWDLVERYPDLVSAAVPVVCLGLDFTIYPDVIAVSSINPKMLKVPIYYIYDTEDQYYPEYCSRSIVRIMLDYGAEGFTYRETSSYGHAMGLVHVTAEDISVLEWLFAQRRDTTIPIVADPLKFAN